jgi:hypothetical protein
MLNHKSERETIIAIRKLNPSMPARKLASLIDTGGVYMDSAAFLAKNGVNVQGIDSRQIDQACFRTMLSVYSVIRRYDAKSVRYFVAEGYSTAAVSVAGNVATRFLKSGRTQPSDLNLQHFQECDGYRPCTKQEFDAAVAATHPIETNAAA